MARIIAFDGGNRYLISFSGDWQAVQNDLGAMGQVVDLSSHLKMQPFYLHALISRGKWLEFTGGKEAEDRILAEFSEPHSRQNVPAAGTLCAA